MRTSLLLLAVPVFAWAQTLTVSPPAPIAAAGQSIAISASTNVTWSLAGSGTISNQTPTSVTYTAPASVIPQSQMLGCPVLPNDSVFNTRIDALPVDANSATWVSHMNTLGISILPGWGITYADESTPVTTIKPYYGDGNAYPSYTWPAPDRGPALKRENGNYVGVTGYNNQNDHHTLTVRKNDCTFFEMYDDRINGESFVCADGTTPGCNANSVNQPYGWSTGFDPYAEPFLSTDAAGLPLAPLSYHLDEVKAGSIKHAIRFTASAAYINGMTWPAVTENAQSANAPPYGARFRLKSVANGGPNLATVCTANTVVNPDCVTMLTALQQYGMILADIGGNNQLEAITDLNEDATTRAAISIIVNARIGISNFDVVDESSLQPLTAHGFVGGASYEVDPDNTYVTPASYALITATPASGAAIKVPVALQGTAVGLMSNTLTIQAGTWGNYQINSWVNPSSFNQAVTWTKVSGVGAVSSSGVYTPPADINAGSTAVLKVTAAVDSNAVNYVYVTVLATGANPTGAIRIDTGSASGVTDTNGNVWSPDAGLETGISSTVTNDYPGWSSVDAEHAVYESSIYTYGHDITYSLVVPNGNYKIRYMFGQPWNGARPPMGSFRKTLTSGPYLLETQGVVQAHYFDWNQAVNYQMATPVDTYIPARVTNNVLTIAERCITPDTAITPASGIAPLYHNAYPYLFTHLNYDAKSSALNGLEIIPDSSAPHWVIDTQQVNTIAAGESVQLYVVDWYTADADVTTPAWRLKTPFPGVTLTSGGLLSLASGTYLNGQPIVVQAAGAAHSATATLYIAGGSNYALLPSRPVFHYYFKRTITLPPASGGAQTNFPVLVSLSDATLATSDNGGHVQNEKGYDIVPTTDSSCATGSLPFEVESYDAVAGSWVAHVKLPTLPAAGNTTLTLCYGNLALTSDQSSRAAVWDSNYTAVYHFGSVTKDSTSLSNNTISGSIVTTSGLFGLGALFRGISGQYLSVPLPAEPITAGTFETWLYDNIGQTTTGWGIYADHDANGIFQAGVWYAGATMYFGWDTGSTDNRITGTSTQIPVSSGWNHLVYTWDSASNSQIVYLNGVPVITTTTPFTTFVPTLPATLGSDGNNGAFNGILDEVRISKIARSASWVATEYSNQSAPSVFVNLGAEQRN